MTSHSSRLDIPQFSLCRPSRNLIVITDDFDSTDEEELLSEEDDNQVIVRLFYEQSSKKFDFDFEFTPGMDSINVVTVYLKTD